MMEERGQIFTLDLMIAIGIFLLVITTSGHAMRVVGQQSSDYVSRHGLERRAHDVADMLVSSPGNPSDWYENLDTVSVPGLALSLEGGGSMQNLVDARKFFALDNLSDEVLEDLFGTKNFMIKYEGFSNTITHENSSSVENSPEVVSVRRITYGRELDVKGESPMIFGDPAIPKTEPTEFYIENEDIQKYNWYLFVENLSKDQPNKVSVSFNVEAPPTHYKFQDTLPDTKKINENEYLKPGKNFFDHFIPGNDPGSSVVVYLVANEDENLEIDPEMVKEEPRTLTVKVWR